jgi:hypothetical protein
MYWRKNDLKSVVGTARWREEHTPLSERAHASELRRAVEAWARAAQTLPNVTHELGMLELDLRLLGSDDTGRQTRESALANMRGGAKRLDAQLTFIRDLLEKRLD